MIPTRWLVYMLAVSLSTVVGLVGWVFWENHTHQEELRAAVELRETQVNEFLRTEVCERLELRDEIQISYLRAAASKWAYADPAYSEVLGEAARALELTQRGCAAQIPGEG